MHRAVLCAQRAACCVCTVTNGSGTVFGAHSYHPTPPRPTFTRTPCTGTTQPADAYTPIVLKNSHLEARFQRYGATLTHLIVPDANGNSRDIALGWDDGDQVRSGVQPIQPPALRPHPRPPPTAN